MTALLEKARPSEERSQGASFDGTARTARPGTVWNNGTAESCSVNARTIRDAETARTIHVESRARNVLRNRGNFLHTNDRLDVREITQAVATTLSNVTAKELADATGGSVRGAQNVREGLNAMGLAGFLNACRAFPELRALAMDMMGCEAETDPEFVKGISLLMNSYVRRTRGTDGDIVDKEQSAGAE